MARNTRSRRRKLADFRVDFGRYCGQRLSHVPLDYIRWMASKECHDQSAQWIARQYLAAAKR